MLPFTVSNSAREDLKNIFRYTHKHFGEAQADRYLGRLYDAIDDICRSPELGSFADLELSYSIRRLVSDKHLVFYRISGNSIFIDSILHGSMDITREHFEPFQ